MCKGLLSVAACGFARPSDVREVPRSRKRLERGVDYDDAYEYERTPLKYS
jgi:hypothetical protein